VSWPWYLDNRVSDTTLYSVSDLRGDRSVPAKRTVQRGRRRRSVSISESTPARLRRQTTRAADSPFRRLNLEPQLASTFLAVFARCEFALKVGGFARGDETRVDPDWDGFARAIGTQFDRSHDPRSKIAAAYLLEHPPKKQVLVDGRVEWRDAPLDKNLTCTEQLLLAVRRVRNNLFHGGKFLPAHQQGSDRDRLLVQHSLTVLRTYVGLHPRVLDAYVS
jgi:hypothetical protein